MNNHAIVAVPLVDEQRMVEGLLEDPNEESFAGVFKILAPSAVHVIFLQKQEL